MRQPTKPFALQPGARIAIVAPASPVEKSRLDLGMNELARLGYESRYSSSVLSRNGYFAGPTDIRKAELEVALSNPDEAGVFCARGGYGSNYLLDDLNLSVLRFPKILLGYSDITSVQIFLWQRLTWVTFYGPMVAAGFDAGADASGGYDLATFQRALTETQRGWSFRLQGETLVAGQADGVVLGGCLTMVETTLGTPWELDTNGALLLLEDRGMKPYQVDRALMHLKQAGKFSSVKGIILGDFPDCEAPVQGGPTVREVCKRILAEFGVPVVWGAPIGHTPRPTLTVPLGVGARMEASGSGRLDILEPAVTA